MAATPSASLLKSSSNLITWDYLSGFFDGEGGLIVDFGSGRRVIPTNLRMSQKSREVLEMIAEFLSREGIHTTIGLMNDGTHYLGVQRKNDIIKMANKMKLVVKARQMRAAADYLESRITGNQLLLILQEEHLFGRRKSVIPEFALRKFPFTRNEAKRIGQMNGSRAGNAANRSKMRHRVLDVLPNLPFTFTAVDLARHLGVGRGAAIEQGKFLEREGYVTTTRERGPGRPKIKFTKVERRTPNWQQ